MSKHDPDTTATECMACLKPLGTPQFFISRAYERTIFYSNGRYPEIEIMAAEAIGSYCSGKCLNFEKIAILIRENVRSTFPGIGPVESCSRCGRPVDMTRFHRTWTESEEEITRGEYIEISKPLSVTTLAVACRNCEPPPSRVASADLIISSIEDCETEVPSR